MIRTYTLDCHAANPQMPLEPVCPYTGSAATFVLVNLPRPHGKQRIDAVTLSITNADAAVSAHPATREGSSWIVTVPAAAIGPAGNVKEAIIISASGVDEQNRPVSSWIVAVADLRVKNQDGTAVPGEPRVLISWFDSRPANPRGVFICPSRKGQAALDLYDGHNYRPLGAAAEVLGKLPLRALPPYLHYLPFDDTYPSDAAWLYAQLGPSDMGRCSAVRRGGKLWRNYDWTFDDAAVFVVKVSCSSSRFGSVGVASVGSRLTENDVMSAVNSRYYKCLPGMTLDGINEKGVVCEINVDGGPKTGWHGDAEDEGIHILAAVRWALDRGETAQQAAEWLADHIIQPSGEMNFHFMVADATKTYVVENGAAHDVTDGTKVLTNYAIYDETHAGGGKERYDLLSEGADISAVNFTNAYQSGNTWDSDFESAAQHAEAIRQWAEQGSTKEAHRGKTTSSGKAWWQSVHTTEYDFAAKTMKVAVQEVDDWYIFAVDAAAQSIETDDIVTRDSANGVKSSGIWSAIWGALTALPTGFSSLYDWCVRQLEEKADVFDLNIHVTDTEVHFSSGEKSLIYADISSRASKTLPEEEGNLASLTADGGLADSGVPKTRVPTAAKQLEWDGKRDRTDLSLDTWIAGKDAPESITGQPEWIEALECWSWSWRKPDGTYESFRTFGETSPDDPGPIELYDEIDIESGRHFTATRDRIAKKSDIFGNDGKPSDEFATNLLGKQVAKTALMIPLETVEAGTSTITAEDGHAYAVTMTGTVTITMPTTTEGKAAIFQARFSAAAQQSVQFDTDDVVKFDGMDCGIVKAGKDALLSAMWNGEAWDLVWKNQA